MFLFASTPAQPTHQTIANQRQAIASLRAAIAALEQYQLDIVDPQALMCPLPVESSPMYTLLIEQLMHIAAPEARLARLELQIRQARQSLAIAEAKLAKLEVSLAVTLCSVSVM